jgi:thymidylate synthase (FAD)
MNNVKLQWATPNIDKEIMYMARVSNPEGQDSEKIRLLYYCMEEGHVSPFDMANVCMEVNTTRDIARQILRHKSFFFQEFSQRYADVAKLGDWAVRECRLQDNKNRQNSLETDDDNLKQWWLNAQRDVAEQVEVFYSLALHKGIAKEQARALLPEGLTPSRVYMNGTMRSWIFYLKQRLHESTQKEHRLVAQDALTKLREVAPITMDAFFPNAEGR